METLGYGSHLILDGFRAERGAEQPKPASPLADEARLRSLLRTLALGLEPKLEPEVWLERQNEGEPGYSGAVWQAESHLAVHSFERLGALTLSVFSRRGLDPRAFERALEPFGLRRFESHLKNHAKTMARESAQRRRTLLGDRRYAALRLADLAVL